MPPKINLSQTDFISKREHPAVSAARMNRRILGGASKRSRRPVLLAQGSSRSGTGNAHPYKGQSKVWGAPHIESSIRWVNIPVAIARSLAF
jgi:hypothetical protein